MNFETYIPESPIRKQIPLLPLDVPLVRDESWHYSSLRPRAKYQGPATMDNYYNRASPQELRYRDVLDAISALGSEAKELADELDHVVWQVVNRAVDAAVMEHDRQILTNIAERRPPARPIRGGRRASRG